MIARPCSLPHFAMQTVLMSTWKLRYVTFQAYCPCHKHVKHVKHVCKTCQQCNGNQNKAVKRLLATCHRVSLPEPNYEDAYLSNFAEGDEEGGVALQGGDGVEEGGCSGGTVRLGRCRGPGQYITSTQLTAGTQVNRYNLGFTKHGATENEP